MFKKRDEQLMNLNDMKDIVMRIKFQQQAHDLKEEDLEKFDALSSFTVSEDEKVA